MRKHLAILILAILTLCLPADSFAQWGSSHRQVDLRLNNGSRFVGLESSWNSVPKYSGTLHLPDGTRICTMKNGYGPALDANFQPTGGTYYKLTPSGQLSALVYYGGRLTGEHSMSGMSYRIESDGIVVYNANASGSSGGSGGSYSGGGYSGGSYSGGSSTSGSSSGSSSGSTYQSRGAVCAGCHGSGLCQRCNGTGLNAQSHRCSLCGGQKRCRSCGGVGKKYY